MEFNELILRRPNATVRLRFNRPLSLTHDRVLSLLRQVDTLRERVNLKKLTLRRQEPMARVYDYEMLPRKGPDWRWRQEIAFPHGWVGEPEMSFEVPGRWLRRHFKAHEPVRDLLVALITDDGLEEAIFTWGPQEDETPGVPIEPPPNDDQHDPELPVFFPPPPSPNDPLPAPDQPPRPPIEDLPDIPRRR